MGAPLGWSTSAWPLPRCKTQVDAPPHPQLGPQAAALTLGTGMGRRPPEGTGRGDEEPAAAEDERSVCSKGSWCPSEAPRPEFIQLFINKLFTK